ncbi:MAG: hypothetical protein ACTSR3_14215, partial [Candidatus Helarchaeota archaeon]
GTAINFNVDGLDLGVYTFRIAVNDTSGNSAYHDVQVTVVDTTVPNILSPIPSNIQYEFGSTGHIITWYWNESHPDKYNITRLDGPYVNVSATSYTNGTAINLNVDGLDLGVYTFRIAVNDTSGNSAYHDVQVTVVDTTVPNILVPIPSDFQYEFGSTGHIITWYWNESHPDKYNITRLDGPYVNISATSYTNGTAINFNVDGLDIGVYTFRIAVNDTSGNSAYHDVQVTVVDTTVPNILSPIPSNIQYEFGSTGHIITWYWNESHPDKYNITRLDGPYVNVTGTAYTNGTAINFNVDGLDIGIYTFRIAVNDTSGNSAYHDVQVTVVDTTVPNILSPIPSNIQYEFGSTGHIITWIWNESHPDMYNITRLDGPYVNVTGTAYTNGTAINFNVNGLDIGVYTFRIAVNDTSGNSNYDDVQVTVVDTTAPNILTPIPSNIQYEFGSTGNIITWIWNESHPDMYNITRLDGPYVNVTGTAYTNGTAINFNVDGLDIGVYTFRIAINDTTGNSATHDVQVTVVDTTLPNILTPIPSDIQYEFGSTGNIITWIWNESHPDMYNITRLDGPYVNITGTVYSNGTAINFNIDGLDLGVYTFRIAVNDTSSNSAYDDVQVTVVDTTAPNILTPIPSDFQYEFGSTGNIITWYWNESHPDMYNITRLDGPYVNVTGTVYSNGTAINFNVDGLDLGVYTFRIAINDTTSNSATHDVQVTVIDTTAPNILTPIPSNIQYEFGATGYIITWYWNESHPDMYNITRLDGPYVNVTGTAYTNGTAINFNVDGLDLGTYTFRIAVNDSSGNSAYHDVQVTVVDTTLPNTLTPIPSDIQYEFGATGHIITWYWNESHPDMYNITRLDGPYVNVTGTAYANGTAINFNVYNITRLDGPYVNVTGTAYANGTAINFNVDGLDIGVYTFRIAVNDTSGNSAYHDVQVTVVDTTIPNILTPIPSDFQYEFGSTNNIITWYWNESHPDMYNITRLDGPYVNVTGTAYANGTAINFNVDGLDLGY